MKSKMIEIDSKKYVKYACQTGLLYHNNRVYEINLPDNNRTYRWGNSFPYHEKSEHKEACYPDHLYLEIIEDRILSARAFGTKVEADRDVYSFVEKNLDHLLLTSCTYIVSKRYDWYRAGGDKKRPYYVIDNEGMKLIDSENPGEDSHDTENKERISARIIWDHEDGSYAERYYKARNAIYVYDGPFYVMFPQFVEISINDFGIHDFDEALELFKTDPKSFVTRNPESNYDRNDPVISIRRPDIMRKTGNKDIRTFDYVQVEMALRSSLNISDDFIRDNMGDFDTRIREKIDKDKRYQKFGVPARFLSLYTISKVGKSTLKFWYELKDL